MKKIIITFISILSFFFFSVGSVFAAPSIHITSPVSIDTFSPGEYMPIVWDDENVDTVSLFLISEGGSISTIVINTPNSGRYNWLVDVGDMFPGQEKYYKIKVIAYQDGIGSIFSQSDGYFSILYPEEIDLEQESIIRKIDIISQADDEEWAHGHAAVIVWTGENIDRVDVYLMRGEDEIALTLASNLAISSLLNQWTLPFSIPYDIPAGDSYKIKIVAYEANGGQIEAWNNGSISILWDTEESIIPQIDIPDNASPVTIGVTDITPTSAVLLGAINPNMNLGVYVWFEVLPDALIRGQKTSRIFIPAEYNVYEKKALVTGLIPNTEYEYRMSADIRGKLVTGNVKSFKTRDIFQTVDNVPIIIEEDDEIIVPLPDIASVNESVSTYQTLQYQYGPISGDLSLGMENEKVLNLQKMLAGDSNIYPEGIVSGYYGGLTQKAIERFQIKHNIVRLGTPDTTGFGSVGPKTRVMLNTTYVRRIEFSSVIIPEVTEEETIQGGEKEEIQGIIDTLINRVLILQNQLLQLIKS